MNQVSIESSSEGRILSHRQVQAMWKLCRNTISDGCSTISDRCSTMEWDGLDGMGLDRCIGYSMRFLYLKGILHQKVSHFRQKVFNIFLCDRKFNRKSKYPANSDCTWSLHVGESDYTITIKKTITTKHEIALSKYDKS